MWKIKLGEGQHLYTRCIAIPVLTSFVRNVQPPQAIYTERLTHFFPHVVVMSASSTDLLSIYFLLGKKTPTGTEVRAEHTRNFHQNLPRFAQRCTRDHWQLHCYKPSAANNNITEIFQFEFGLEMA